MGCGFASPGERLVRLRQGLSSRTGYFPTDFSSGFSPNSRVQCSPPESRDIGIQGHHIG
jgi:hypothetical protein